MLDHWKCLLIKAETEVATEGFLEPDPTYTGVGKWRYRQCIFVNSTLFFQPEK